MIVYSWVCRGRDAAILVDFLTADVRGNAGQVIASLMEYLRDHPYHIREGERRTFVQQNEADNDAFSSYLESVATALGDDVGVDTFYVHVLKKEGLYFGCIGDDPNPKDQKVSFAFLDALYKEFIKKFRRGTIQTANAYSLSKTFSPSIRSLMYHHNVNHDEIAKEARVKKLMSQVEDMKTTLGHNINILVESGEDLSKLFQKSEDMQQETIVFKKKTRVLKRKTRRSMCLCSSLGVVVVLLVLYLTAIGICGVGFQYCGRHRGSSSNKSNDDAGNDNSNDDGN